MMLDLDFTIFFLYLRYPIQTHVRFYVGEVVSNHDELMSNFFAQPDALAYGKVHSYSPFLPNSSF
jgi:hypothetical protein